jgi:Ribosome inactivating protein
MTIPTNQIGHLWLNFGAVPSQTQGSQYVAFLASLRQAVGNNFRNGVLATQNAGNELVRVDLTSPDGHTIWLWFTPNNLYVRGVTAADGTTYTFNDGDYFLWRDMVALGAGRAGQNPLMPVSPQRFNTLNFGSNYNSLRQAAGRGRENMPISMNDLIGSVNQLATLQPGGVNQEATARSLSFLIQFTSEAARFWDVAGVFTDVMTRPDSNYHGLPDLQQHIENSWDQITRYAYAVTQNPATPSLNVIGVQRLNNFGDVQRRVAILMGQPNFVSSTGDWSHTEL